MATNGSTGSSGELQDRVTELEAQAGVDRALIAHLEADGVVDRAKIADLEVALTTCRRIGAAIGILMNQRKVSEAEAFDALRVASQQRQTKLRDVAEDVMQTGSLDPYP